MKASKKLVGCPAERHFVYNLSLSSSELFRLRDALEEVIIKERNLIEHSHILGNSLPCLERQLKELEYLFSTIDNILFL